MAMSAPSTDSIQKNAILIHLVIRLGVVCKHWVTERTIHSRIAITRLTTNCASNDRLRSSSLWVLALACSIAVAGIAISIALSKSAFCISGDTN